VRICARYLFAFTENHGDELVPSNKENLQVQ
jgi:hypothetical protein